MQNEWWTEQVVVDNVEGRQVKLEGKQRKSDRADKLFIPGSGGMTVCRTQGCKSGQWQRRAIDSGKRAKAAGKLVGGCFESGAD